MQSAPTGPRSVPPRSLRLIAVLTAACALRALLACPALCAQQLPERPDAEVAGRPRIVIPLALDAQSQIEAAGRLTEKGQWEQALPMLQGLLDGDRHRMIQNGAAYVPVAGLVNRRIADLPEDARATYALLYDPAAKRLYDEGLAERSAPILREVAERYWNTTYGVPAASALASVLMDEGEFGPALLALDGADIVSPPAALAGAVAAKKLICLAKLGERARAEQVVADLSRRGVSSVTVAGKQQELDAFVRQAFRELAPPPREDVGWPCLGGNAAGNAAPPPFAPSRLFPLGLGLRWQRPVQATWPFAPSVRPIAGKDAVFLVRDGALLAIDRKTRRALWAAPPPELEGASAASLAEAVAPDDEPLPTYVPVGNIHRWRALDNHGLATLCLDEGRLFAVRMNPLKLSFPAQSWTAQPQDFMLVNELRCYDAASGHAQWSVGGNSSSSPPALQRCWFFSAPTVSNGRAYVLAARDGELHALCLKAETGEPVWDSLVGPFESRQEAQRYAMELFAADTGPPAVADGIAVFPTGQGLACACDVSDGRLLWISPYPRASVWIDRLGTTINVSAGPWLPGQPLVSGDLCLLAPTDSRCLLALSVRTGATIWQQEFARGTAVLGADGERLYVQHLGAACLDLATGRRIWERSLDAEPVGIGALGRDALCLPEREGVRRLAAGDGRDLGLLRWPPGTATNGNLLLLDDALIASSAERLAFCPAPEAALAAADADVQADPAACWPLLARGTLRAWNADAAGAAADVERALAIARDSSDSATIQSVNRQGALCLSTAAVETGDGKLLDRASELAPNEPAVQAELAKAKVRWSLQQPGARNAAGTYVSLCRRTGMLQQPTNWATVSLWTELARIVREECAAQPATADAWQTGVQALIEDAGSAGDTNALEEVAACAPSQETRIAALLQLGRAYEAAGQLEPARRAFAQVIAADPTNAAVGRAAEGLKRVLAAAGEGGVAEDYVAELLSRGPPWELRDVPTSETAWTRPGVLVRPAGPVGTRLLGRALVLNSDRLDCVDAAGGNVLWSAQLPAGKGPAGESPAGKSPAGKGPAANRSAANGRAAIGPGYPAYILGAPAAVVALSGALVGVDAKTGAIRWDASVPAGGALSLIDAAVLRLELIRRARRGLPTPAPEALRRSFLSFGIVADALVTASAGTAGRVTAADVFSGRSVLDRSPAAPVRGVLAALANGRLCIAYQQPPSLLVFDAGGRLLAEWSFPGSLLLRALRAADGATVTLADCDGVFRFSLTDMELAAVRMVPDGVARLLYADASLAVVRTMRGSTVAVETAGGTARLELARPDQAQAVWATRRGDVLYLLEAAAVSETVPSGPDCFFSGSGFAVQAVRLPSGTPLWRCELPGDGMTVSTPVPCGDVWLLSASKEGQVGLIGVDSASGRRAFAVQLSTPGSRGPAPFVVSAGRVVIGLGDSVRALTPSGRTLRDAVAEARAGE
jgi:outer membrane protein assembly factor BamB